MVDVVGHEYSPEKFAYKVTAWRISNAKVNNALPHEARMAPRNLTWSASHLPSNGPRPLTGSHQVPRLVPPTRTVIRFSAPVTIPRNPLT
jgi:hypothetical protein